MKKRLALAAAFAFSIIPFTSFADHLEPDESEIKKGRELVSTKLEDYDLFSNKFSDDILIAFTVNGYEIEPCADLSGADLSDTNLERADLSGCNLTNADLSGAKLRLTDLEGANLSGADLSDTNLTLANLQDANLIRANLQDANLYVSKMTGANLKGANLNGADLNNAEVSNTILSGADLSETNLEKANLEGANLKKADLRLARLRYVDLEGADLSRAKLEKVFFYFANLDKAKLKNAKLSGADFNQTGLEGADLSGADLTNITTNKLGGCPSKLPSGWVCEGKKFHKTLRYDNSLIFFTHKPKNEKKVKVFISSLPYQTECGLPFLKISLSNNGKYLVQLGGATKYAGFDFKKAGKKFNQEYKVCEMISDLPTIQPVNPNPASAPSINF